MCHLIMNLIIYLNLLYKLYIDLIMILIISYQSFELYMYKMY